MRARFRLAAGAAALLLPLLGGCAELFHADDLTAARADSSAAGYDFGRPDVAEPPLVVTLYGKGRAQWQRHIRPILHPPVEPIRLGGAIVRMPAGGRRDGGAPSGSRQAPDVTQPAPRDSTFRPRPGGRPDTLPAIAPLDTAVLPDTVVLDRFAAFHPREQRVVLRLVAGFTGDNDALNFNGGTHGSGVLIVPTGWQLELQFVNQDPTLSHSAIVIPNAQPLPVTVPAAAFPGAFTARVQEGLQDGATDVVAFVAAAAGEYMIACGVPGHAQGGMWIRLRVVPGQIPAYERR